MSEIATLDTSGLAVVGRGLVTAPDLNGLQRSQTVSLYADPVSWLVLEAVKRAMSEGHEDLLAASEAVGHITVSDHCTTHTMRGIAAAVPAGRVSPLRFSGANPGSICSLPSQLLGFSGPSMTLSMPAEKGLPTAVAIARVWLHQRSAAYVLVTSHSAGDSEHRITSAILKACPGTPAGCEQVPLRGPGRATGAPDSGGIGGTRTTPDTVRVPRSVEAESRHTLRQERGVLKW
jgi:hypothetical protein